MQTNLVKQVELGTVACPNQDYQAIFPCPANVSIDLETVESAKTLWAFFGRVGNGSVTRKQTRKLSYLQN